MITKTLLMGGILGLSALFSTASFAFPHHGYPGPHVRNNYHSHPNSWRYNHPRWAPRQNIVVIETRPRPFWFGYYGFRYW